MHAEVVATVPTRPVEHDDGYPSKKKAPANGPGLSSTGRLHVWETWDSTQLGGRASPYSGQHARKSATHTGAIAAMGPFAVRLIVILVRNDARSIRDITKLPCILRMTTERRYVRQLILERWSFFIAVREKHRKF